MLIQKMSNKVIKPFYEIEIGEVFKYGNNYFLKITTIYKQINIDDCIVDGEYNAIWITTGKAAKFSNNAEVIKIDAKLIVDN